MKLQLPHYKPNPAQALAHKYALQRRRVVLYQGGYGAGKSTFGAWQTIRNVLECGPSVLHFVGAPSNKILKLASWEAILRILRSFHRLNGWTLEKRIWDSDARREILFKNDALLSAVTLRNPENFSGPDVGTVWIDEAALLTEPAAAFHEMMSRLRHPYAAFYQMLLTTTPRGLHGVIKLVHDAIADGCDDYALVHAPTTVNQANLRPGYISDISRGMSARLARQMLGGEIVEWAGSIYSPEFHGVESVADLGQFRPAWRPRSRRGSRLALGIDWGANWPAAVFVELGEDGIDLIFDEVIPDQLGGAEPFLRQVIKRLRQRWNLRPGDIDLIRADPNPPEDLKVCRTMFPGVTCRRLPRRIAESVRYGIDVVRGRLLDSNGKRWLLLHPDLKKSTSHRSVYESFVAYRWATRYAGVDGRTLIDQPIKGTYDHQMDAVRYLIASERMTRRSDQYVVRRHAGS